MPQVADTGFLVAYWNKRDAHHRWARGLSVTAPLRTCEAVVTETAYLLGTPEPVLQMLVDGDLTVDFQAETHATDLLRWLEKFADLDPVSPMPVW
jgi:predicted nucleic acid-binding protein